MERADIKLAIDMLEGVKMEEPCEDNMAIDHCINVLEDCGNAIASKSPRSPASGIWRSLLWNALEIGLKPGTFAG